MIFGSIPVLIGAGIGTGFEQPQLAAQTCLGVAEISLGIGVIIFAQTLGQAIFISAAGNVINNEVVWGFREYLPSVNSASALAEGAAELQSTVPSQYIDVVRQIYDTTTTRTFYICVGMARLSLLLVLWSWNSVKEEASGE